MRQHSAKRGAGTPQPVPLGTAEVDLSPLLRPRCVPLTHRLALLKSLLLKNGPRCKMISGKQWCCGELCRKITRLIDTHTHSAVQASTYAFHNTCLPGSKLSNEEIKTHGSSHCPGSLQAVQRVNKRRAYRYNNRLFCWSGWVRSGRQSASCGTRGPWSTPSPSPSPASLLR